MYQARNVIKKTFTPVTLMMIPHDNKKVFNIKIPLVCILVFIFFWVAGTSYTLFTAVSSIQYKKMKENLSFYTDQFNTLKMTMVALKNSEEQFRYLFSLGSREAILKNSAALDSGNVDISALKDQIKLSMEAVVEITDYHYCPNVSRINSAGC